MSRNFNTIQPQPEDNENIKRERTFRKKLLDAGKVAWEDIGSKSPLTKAGMVVGVLAVAITIGEQAADLYDVERKPGITRYGGTQEVHPTDRGVAFEGWLHDTIDSAGDAINDTVGNVIYNIRGIGGEVIDFMINDNSDKKVDTSGVAPIGELFEIPTSEVDVSVDSFLSGEETIPRHTPDNAATPESQSVE